MYRNRGRREWSYGQQGGVGGGRSRGGGRGSLLSFGVPPDLRAFFNELINGRREISGAHDACIFFKAAMNIEPFDMLYSLNDRSKCGENVLKAAFSHSCSSYDHIGKLIEFFEYLGQDDLSRGSVKICTEQCYLAAYRTPGFIEGITDGLLKGRVEDTSALAFWLVCVCRCDAEALSKQNVRKVAELLQRSSCPATMQLATLLTPGKLAELLEKDESLERVRSMQPQHDNDFPLDFRKISVVPTSDELNAVYAGHGGDVRTMEQLREVAVSTTDDDGFDTVSNQAVIAAEILDRQFRFLREDMIAPTKEEFEEEKALRREEQRRIFYDPQALGIELKPRPCIIIRVATPPSLKGRLGKLKTRGERISFMEGPARRVLGRDSMVLFVKNGSISHVAIITRRDKNEMVQNPSHLVVGVTLQQGSLLDFLAAVPGTSKGREQSMRGYSCPPRVTMGAFIYQASCSLFAYEPVLTRLQQMVSIPFVEQIALRSMPSPLDSEGTVELPAAVARLLRSDPSQLGAVRQALDYNLTLIQGPPGTGKTFVGVQIVRALYMHHQRLGKPLRILCLCFTNHALDNFLEALVDAADVPLSAMIRIGSSPKISPRLKSRCIGEMDGPVFDRMQTRRFAQLKQSSDQAENEIREAEKYLESKQWGEKWWNTASEFLCMFYPQDYGELSAASEMKALRQHGMSMVGRKGKESHGDHHWVRFCRGLPREESFPVPQPPRRDGAPSIWTLDKAARISKLAQWSADWRKHRLKELADAMIEYDTCARGIDDLRGCTKVGMLRNATIIGCTTTSAAKNSNLLEEAAPNVVIVEEAAEVLEAHILTNLTPSVKRIVMIGDHKQLRPKLEYYPLRKESGNHIDFDESLFERLALQEGFPVKVLNVQHRMRPEISALVRRTTYPTLEDHPTVQGRPDIIGLSRNMIFIAHEHLESSDEDRAALGTNSKINKHEVEMVVCIAQYLLQQGYAVSDIVVLTPYLGQLVQIQGALVRRHICVEIGDSDRADLARANVVAETSKSGAPQQREKASSTKSDIASTVEQDSEVSEKEEPAPPVPSIRVATVDNYQGEESKIVIASLVRSNDERDIGFLSGPERVNVLFSRARDGFIIIGNAVMLRNARSQRGRTLWSGVLDILSESGAVFNGLPVVCPRHGSACSQLLLTPADFALHAPEGGCALPCGQPLPGCPHGHCCPRKCHKIVDGHKGIPCMEKMPELCTQGHPVLRTCSASEQKLCRQLVRDDCPVGHIRERMCCQRSLSVCETCEKIKKQREQEEQRQRLLLQQQEAEAIVQEERLAAAQARLVVEAAKQKMLQRIQRAQQEAKLVEEELARIAALNQKEDKEIEKNQENDHRASKVKKITEKRKINVKERDGDEQGKIAVVTTVQKEEVMFCGQCGVTDDLTETTEDDGRGNLTDIDMPSANSLNQGTNNVTATEGKELDKVNCGQEEEHDDEEEEDGNDNEDEEEENHNDDNVEEEDDNDDNEDKEEEEEATVTREDTNAPAAPSMDAMMRAVVKEDWLRLSEMGAALLSGSKGELSPENVSNDLLRCLLLIPLAALQLGEPPEVVRNTADKLRYLVDQRGDKTSECLLYLIDACVEARLGDVPLSAAKYARQALDIARDSSVSSLPSNLLAMAQVIVDAGSGAVKPAHTDSNKPSGSQQQWERVKSEKSKYKTTLPQAMDDLLKLTGLETVKMAFIREFHKISLSKEQGASLRGSSYNTRCDGNPGTGKTTVAKLYADFLIELGILPETSSVEITSGSKLLNGGISDLKKLLEGIKEKGGGVVFVDEAYQLSPKDDRTGRQVLDFILTHAERLDGEYGPLVWIFAGYRDHMDKLFEHNPGLPSRFPIKFVFEDYTNDELLTIFNAILVNGGKDVSAAHDKRRGAEKASAAEKQKSSPDSKKPKSIPMNPYYGRGVQFASMSKPDLLDEWGNTWRWDPSVYLYRDDYGHITAVGLQGLGTYTNPVVSEIGGKSWTYDRRKKCWIDYSGNVSSTYPDKPVAPPKQSVEELPKKPFTVSDAKWVRIAIRRLGRGRGGTGFGNARAVRALFDETRRRQAERIAKCREKGFTNIDVMQFVRDDLLGPRVDQEALERCDAWQKLLAMEGLQEVKDEVARLLELVLQNADREEAEKPIFHVVLNRIFLGNPGTGKTTVAALYGQILRHFGLLSKGDLILKNPSDFIGSALGMSEDRTRGILEAAKGCVLVIDEAYSLGPPMGAVSGNQDPYKDAVVNTIVEQVQGVPGDDRVVVLLGYRKEMEAMLAAVNPGLSRRFQLENAFNFEDYDDASLLRILRNSCAKTGTEIDLPTASYAIKQLARARAQPNFGNAGAVNNLLSSATLRMQTRLSRLPKHERRDRLIEDDFAAHDHTKTAGVSDKIFDGLMGCEAVRDKVMEYKDAIQLCKQLGREPRNEIEYNFIFAGPPGTGKTTVARRMGQLFSSMGLLPCEDVVETSASDLVTGYAGQAGKKTHDVMMKARGKVLFIDEAYQLNPLQGGSYMQEVVDELVKCLTAEEFKGKMIVILAGYEADIDAMLDVNQGLRSRFSEKLIFAPFTSEQVMQLLEQNLREKDLILSEEAKGNLLSIAEKLTCAPSFANGRDVETYAKRVFRMFARRASKAKAVQVQVEVEDLELALQSFLDTKKSVARNYQQVKRGLGVGPLQFSTAFAAAPDTFFKQMSTELSVIEVVEENTDFTDRVEELKDDVEEGVDLDQSRLAALQTLLDQQGLNNRDGAAIMARFEPGSVEFAQMAVRLAKILGVSADEAAETLHQWQKKYNEVEDKLEEIAREEQLAKAQNQKFMRPIWRCGVCGRDDKPWIACYVAPFIVRYEEMEF